MKLEEITGAMLAQAIGIYLRLAYPHAKIPPHVRDRATVDPAAPLAAALGRECVEKFEMADRRGYIDKYRWRLGNDRYPHMKLGIERCSEADDFVFNVDTHDREFPIGSPIIKNPAFHELLAYNRRVKGAIEAEWGRAGLPTFREHVARYLHHQCAVSTGTPKTVLIVDDDEAVLELEKALVEEAGFRVVIATSGLDALARLESLGTVDLCLLDIMMPTFDGLEVARRMRDECAASFPIVFVTALPRDRAECDAACDYVAKPFDPDVLLDVIRKHVG